MKIDDIEIGKDYTLLSTIGEGISYVCTVLDKDVVTQRVKIIAPELVIGAFDIDPRYIEARGEA